MSEIRVDTVSEKTSANGVAIDSVTLKDGGITATAASTITVADNSDTLSLISTDADANAGPVLRLFRNSASPADDDVAGSIVFSGEDDGGNETDYASIKVITEDVTDGTEDGRLSFNIIDGASAVEVMSIFDNFVGIGTTAPEQVLHVHGGDSGSSYSADNADRLIIENNDSLRIDMRTGATNTAGIMFSDATRNVGSVNYSHNSNEMTLNVNSNTNHGLRIDSSNNLSTNGETSPDVSLGGLCLNQGANDDKILTLKSSDVAHGITDFAETDTYAVFEKVSAGSGGLRVEAFMETISAIAIRSFHVNENTTQASSGSDAAILIDSCVKNGTTVTGNSDSANMVCFRDNTIPRVFITGDGDVFSDRAFSDNAFDHYNDAHLVRAFDLSTENKNGVIDSKFDDFIKYNAQKLADLKILGKNTDGTPSTFVNINGLQRLHNGAIWQQYEKHQRLASAFYKLAEKTIGKEEADKLLTEEEIQLLN